MKIKSDSFKKFQKYIIFLISFCIFTSLLCLSIYADDPSTVNITSAADLNAYSVLYNQDPSSHQTDTIRIDITDGTIIDISSNSFVSIGTSDYPFAGELIFPSSSLRNFLINKALFAYISTDAKIQDTSSVNTFIAFTRSAAADTHVFAENVVAGTTKASWILQYNLTTNEEHTNAGLIGTIGEGAEVDISFSVNKYVDSENQNDSNSNFHVVSNNDTAIFCSKLDSDAKLNIVSFTDDGVSYTVTSNNGNAGGFVGTMEDGSVFTIKDSSLSSTSTTITATNGNAGGLVGEMKATETALNPTKIKIEPAITMNEIISGKTNSGMISGLAGDNCVLSFDYDFTISTTASSTSSDGASGGLIGNGTNTIIEIKTGKYIEIKGTITGSTNSSYGTGGLFGYYSSTATANEYTPEASYSIFGSYDSTLNKRTLELEQIKLDVKLYSGSCGGLFGILNVTNQDIEITDSSMTISTSKKGETITKVVKTYTSSCSGGLIGSYANSSLTKTLYIHNTKTSFYCNNATNSAGYIGYAGRLSGSSAVYVKFENNCASISGSVGAGYIADLYINGDFIDFTGINAVSGSVSAGLINTSTKGVIRLAGTTDFNGNYLNSRATLTDAQIIKTHNGTLIYALGSGNNAGWTFNRTSNDRKDDIYDWGEVLRIVYNSIAESDLFTVDETNHTCTIKAADLDIDNLKEFILTALNIQLNDGTNKGALIFADTTNTSSVLLTQTISLNTDINLSGTGIIGFTRDNEFNDAFSGTLDGNDHTITLAIGEDYGGSNNTTIFNSASKGSGALFNRYYEGIFAKVNGATIQDLTINGTINLISNRGTKESTIYRRTGALGSSLDGNATLSGVTLNHTTNIYSKTGSTTKLVTGGAFGIVSYGSTGTLNITNCTFNSTFNDIRSNTDNLYESGAGGVIGKVDTENSFTFNIGDSSNDIVLSSKYNNVTYNEITSSNVNTMHYGGLIGYIIATNNSISNRTLNLKNIKVTDDFSINSNTTADNVDTCGILGSAWISTTVNVGTNASSTDGITIGTSAGSGTTITQTGTTKNLAALVYVGTGYWRINHVDVQKLNITGSSTGTFGFIVNKATSTANNSALYLEVINTGTQYNIAYTTFTSGTGFTVYDEIVAYSHFDNKAITDNGQAVISVTTTDGNKIKMTSSGCNTYQNKTSYGINTIKSNSHTRYYYNLDTIRTKATPSDPEKLLLWSVYIYGNTKDVRTVFLSFLNHPNGKNFNMDGLSYYPVNADFTLTGNSTLKFYNEEIEAHETQSGNSDNFARSTLTETQHYLMHTSLLYNSSSVSITSIKLQGNTGNVDGKSGFIVLNALDASSSTTVKLSKIGTLTLDGVRISNYNSTYSPLIINSVGNNVNLSISNAKVNSPSNYSSLINANKYAATSLIGKVGSKTGRNITVVFSNMTLDARKTNDGATYLDTAYKTTRTIFEIATFLHSFTYETNGYGEYNYTYDEDWGDGEPHNVTYGYEVTGSIEYVEKEEKYYKDTKYTRPDDTDFTQAYDFTTNYRPYVYERDLANNKHEIRVNLYNADIIEGCGQYNDPYIIDSTAVFKSIADILNGTNYEIEIKLPIGLGKSSNNDQNQMWHDDGELDQKFQYSNGNFVYNTTSYSVENVRKYLAGAYYKITSTLELEDFTGLSNCEANPNNDYTFHGVIIGNNNTIINKTASPLIAVANGCVIKDLNIVVDSTITISVVDNTLGYTNISTSSQAYGAFIGRILYGDNIIDNSYVSFGDNAGFTIVNTNKTTRLYPVGAYVGCVVNGCIVFRNYNPSEEVNGITDSITNSKVTDSSYIYFNPIVGRIIYGYAFNETNNTYTNRYVKESVVFKNGDKNYSIPDLNPDNTNKLDVTYKKNTTYSNSNAYYMDIPDAQAFYILSCIVNSYQTYASSNSPYENSTYGQYAMTRNAKYNEVGESTSTDYAIVKANDVMSKTNVPYAILHYTTYTSSNYYIRFISNGRVIQAIDLTANATYDLPKGFRGIGNIKDGNSLIQFKVFNGNGATIDLDMKFFQYNHSSEVTTYRQSSDCGFGLFNKLRQNSSANGESDVLNKISNLTIQGNVYYDVINIDTGLPIYYQFDTASNNGLKSTYYASVGSFGGICDTAATFENITFGELSIEGPRFAGGLIGYCSSRLIIKNIKSQNEGVGISVSAGQLTGGLVGVTTNNLSVKNDGEFFNNSLNLRSIVNKVYFNSKIRVNGTFLEVAAGGLVGRIGSTTELENINIKGLLNSYNDPVIDQLSWHSESKCVTGGVIGVINADLTATNITLTKVLARGGYCGGFAGNVAKGNITMNTFTYDGCDEIIGSGYTDNTSEAEVQRNKTPGTLAAIRSCAGLFGRTIANNNYQMYFSNILIKNATIASTYRQKTNVGSDTFYSVYTSGNDDDKANSGDTSIAAGLIAHFASDNAVSEYASYDFKNVKLSNLNIFTLYDKTSNNHRSTYGSDLDKTASACVGTGGLFGTFEKAVPITGNNILMDNVNINHYNYSVSAENKDNSNVTGIIIGYLKGTTNGFIKLVGLSIKKSTTDNLPIIYGGGYIKNTSNKEFLYDAQNGTYVVFADYNSISATNDANQAIQNTITVTSNDVGAANPYVVNNPKTLIGSSTQYLTGDGTANNTGDLAIFDISPTYYTLAATSLNSFTTKNYTNKFSTFNSEHGDNITNDVAFLIVDNLSRSITTEMINLYLQSLTNTNYDFVKDVSKIFHVDLYKLTYESATGEFEVTNNSNLKKINDNLVNYFYIESNSVDSGNDSFSLIDVSFFDPKEPTKVAYHLYVPVFVKKMLNYTFDIATGTGTNYESAWYIDNNRFGKPLMENLGSPISLYFKYTYTRTQEEWQSALVSGDNIHNNYSKSLLFTNTDANNTNPIPDDTILVLVDPSLHKTYYAYFENAYTNGEIVFSAFNTKLDGTGDAYSTRNFDKLLNISVSPNNSSGLFVITNDESEATVEATYNNQQKYFRLWTTEDGNVDRFNLTVNNTNDQTLGYVVLEEPYYLSFFTEANSSNIIYHYMVQSKSTLATNDFSYPSKLQNANASGSSVHIYLGNIFVQEQNDFHVQATNANQEISVVNNELNIVMSTIVKIKNDILSEVETALSGNSGINVYQAFLLNLTKKTEDKEINIIEGNPTIAGKYTISKAVQTGTAIANTTGSYDSSDIHNNSSNVVFINGIPLNNYLVNGGVSIESILTLTYNGDGNISAQFPGKSNPESPEGVRINGQSSMSFDANAATTSKNVITKSDEYNMLYYYRIASKKAILYYNVISNNQSTGDLSNLGLNPLDSNDPLLVEIKSLGVYSIGDIMAEAEGYDYVKYEVQLSCKQDDYSSALTLGDYMERINDNTSISTTTYTYVFKRTDLSSTMIQIPINFVVVTGADFEALSNHYYSNYMVTLTVQLAKNANGTDLLSESRASNYIIYTNAKIIPDFIEWQSE